MHDTANENLNELEEARDDGWEDLKAGVESAWNSLGSSLKSAASHFRWYVQKSSPADVHDSSCGWKLRYAAWSRECMPGGYFFAVHEILTIYERRGAT